MAQHETDKNAEQSLLLFSYELSPISVQFYQSSENVFDFLIHICAIVGGIFTIAGILDSMIYNSVGMLFKKRIGKLS